MVGLTFADNAAAVQFLAPGTDVRNAVVLDKFTLVQPNFTDPLFFKC